MSLAHMGGSEQEFVREAFETNWVVPLGPNVDGFEHDLSQWLSTHCDQEVHAVTEYIKQRHETTYDEDVVEKINQSVMSDAEKEEAAEEYDPRLPEAVEIVVEAGQASVSMLQRRMRVGYARAGRLIDEMEQRGIVSEADGAKPRAVLISREEMASLFE